MKEAEYLKNLCKRSRESGVKLIEAKLEPVEKLLEEYEYLLWFRFNADFGPAECDVIHDLNGRFKEETRKDLPEGWREE
jgi:hypothetical protein